MKTEKVYRYHVVTDMGNGGSYCSKCGTSLDPPHDNLGISTGPAPYPCPCCGAKWIDTPVTGYAFGGSDF